MSEQVSSADSEFLPGETAGEEISVLHVEDDPDFAELTATFLSRENPDIDVETAHRAAEGLDRLAADTYDCVVSDYDMPGENGIEFLERVRETHDELPFILFTGKGSEEVASRAISAGVTDYLQKGAGSDQFVVLANRVENAVESARSRQALAASQRRLSLFVDQSPLGVIEWTPDLEVVALNDAAEELLGYSQADLVGESWEAIVPPDERETVAEIADGLESATGGFHSVNDNVTADGERITCEWHNRVVADGEEVLAVFSQFRDVSDRQAHDEPLVERDLVAQTLDTMEDIVYVIDTEGRLQWVNERAAEVTGTPREELVGTDPTRVFPPEERERVATDIQDALETGSSTIEADLVGADGEPVPYEFRKRRLTDEDGTVVGVGGVGRDISARRQQERVRETIIERTTEAVISMDADWRFTLVDDRAAEVVGMSETELLGEDFWEVFADAQGTRFEEVYRRVMREREPGSVEAYYEGLDGWFEVNVYPDEGGGLSLYFRDVTHRKERERALRRLYEITSDTDRDLEEKLEDLLALGTGQLGLSTGLVTRIDDDRQRQRILHTHGANGGFGAGSVLDFSETYCRKTVETDGLFEVEDALEEGYGSDPAYERNDISCYIGSRIRLGDGEEGTLCFVDSEPAGRPFTAFDRSFVELLAQWVSHETGRERVERDLRRQNDRLEEFAGVVSHDLRNPLSVLDLSLELAEESGDPEQFRRCREAVDRMEELVDDLLTLAREGERVAETEPVDLARAAEAAWETTETESADATLAVETEATVRADDSRLRQLLGNLFGNAATHGTREGGGVTVTVTDTDEGFAVADDGPGIPEDDRESVFEAGVTTSDDGTGFGLAIVREVAQAHGWSVSVTASDEGGARFEVAGVERV
jgi:PAS domain S-box-containing protein